MTVALYVHIPYCQHKCGYCDFNSHAGSNPEEQERYVGALIREMELWAVRPEMQGVEVPTLFFGGGTPTMLEGRLLARLIREVQAHFRLAPGAEVTIEANPGTVDVEGEKLALAFGAGANRISFGVQARQAELLQRLGRIHTADQVEVAVAAAKRAGFANINLDLMYGLPGQQVAQFRESLAWALAMGPTHISAYSLIIEEGTPFFLDYEAGRLPLPAEEAEEAMFQEGKRLLIEAGFEHYEVSNFALPGYRSQHNQVYWRNEPFLGLGCGSHSFLQLAAPVANLGPPRPALTASRIQGGSQVETAPGESGQAYRFWNLKHPGTYKAALEQGQLPVEAGEVISRTSEMAESMMMGLRLLDGVSDERFRSRFGQGIGDVYGDEVARQVSLGLLEWQDGSLRLTDRGLRLGNQVWQAFLP